MKIPTTKENKQKVTGFGIERGYENPPENNPVYHTHDGIDQPRLFPKDFHGFPLFDAAPTHTAEEGTFIFAQFGGFIYMYLMLNKVWNLMAVGNVFSIGNFLSVAGITIGGGTPITSVISNTATLNFGAIAANTAADLTMTLTGAAIGDTVSIGIADTVISTGVNCADVTFFAWVSAANTVKIRCLNGSAVNIANPASGTFRSTIIKF